MTHGLEEIICAIVAFEQGQAVSAAQIEEIHTILEECNLDAPEHVPGWVHALFTALRDGQSILPTPCPDQRTVGNVGELFASLADVDALDCLDYGEWVRFRLHRRGMLGFYSLEHDFYAVLPLAEIPDDGKSDLSDAKLYNRED